MASEEENQLKLRYEHAKQANLHADGQIQAADRKGAFLVPVNAALFLLFSSDLAQKVRGSSFLLERPCLLGMTAFVLLLGLGFLVASYVCVYMLVKARLEQAEYTEGWPEGYAPEELIYFGAVAETPKKEYVNRYERLTTHGAWMDLSYQVYKQAKIAAKKYYWFSKARFTSALAGIVGVILTIFIRFVG